ncbi:ATP synthase subunit epsilon, mitochondrial [Capsicum annuum]|nr:ATP synthase subunit epsilon, mitochondrial [Capsicum annuum]
MASNAAAPFWRSAGMTYITYSNLCANLVRNCLKEPYKTEALSREKVHYSISKWVDGKPQKPSSKTDLSGPHGPEQLRVEIPLAHQTGSGCEGVMNGMNHTSIRAGDLECSEGVRVDP